MKTSRSSSRTSVPRAAATSSLLASRPRLAESPQLAIRGRPLEPGLPLGPRQLSRVRAHPRGRSREAAADLAEEQ